MKDIILKNDLVSSKEKVCLNMIVFALSSFYIFFTIEGSFTVQSIIIPIFLLLMNFIFNRAKLKISTPIKIMFLLEIVYIISFFINYIKYQPESSAIIQLLYQFVIFLWFTLALQKTYNKREINFYINTYIFVCLLCSVYVLYFNIVKHITTFAVTGFFGHTIDKNYFAAFLCVGPILSFMKIFYCNQKVKNSILTIITTLAVLFTNSRAALIALCGGIILFLIYYFKERITMKKVIAITFCLIIVVMAVKPLLNLVPEWMYNRYFVSSYNDNSNRDRVLRWKNALDGIKKQPVLGFGPGIFLTIPEYQITEYGTVIRSATASHNTYIDIMVDGGIVGIILFLFLLFTCIKDVIKYNKIYIPIIFILILTSAILGAGKAVYFWNNLIFLNILSEYTKKNSSNESVLE